jgi:hypothetical protein
VGVPCVGVPRGAWVPWSLAPTGDRRPAAARAGREAPDGWAAAQCQTAVSLTGGASMSASAEESASARVLAREENGWPSPDEQ